MKGKSYNTLSTSSKVYCKVFENNFGALELALTLKLWPSKKYIDFVYNHSKEYIMNKKLNNNNQNLQ